MAKRIREFDWSNHPLGPPETWPVALRSALGIALNSAFPTCIYWGSELRLLYNDAWSYIPGPRHPACLGERAADVWSDIWHVIEPQFFQVVVTGAGVYVRDQMLPMRRFGVEEETYWDYNFTPIRGEDGAIAGIFNSGNETTEQVLHERHTRFLLDLSDAFRGMREAAEVRSRSLEMLGVHLGADRVGLRQRAADDSRYLLPVVEQWTADGVEPISGTVAETALSDGIWADLLDGHVIRLDGSDPDRAAVETEVLGYFGCASALAVPWFEGGRTVAVLFVHSGRDRRWSNLEIQTVEEVLERMMGWLERARSMERERVLSREVDHRARNLLSIIHAIVRLAKVEDPDVMQAKLLDRISALGKTHSLLSDNRHGALILGQLVEEELAPYEGAISTSGPDIVLNPDQSQAFAMALHELGTNAAKHGALSAEGGALSVSWELTADNMLRVDWVESGLDRVNGQKPGAKGFGTQLLKLVVEAQLEGRIDRHMGNGGLHCVIEIPWSASGAGRQG